MQNILLYFLQSLPECIGLISFSLVLAQVPLKWDRIFIFGLFLAIFTYVIKILPIAAGIHLLSAIFLIFIFINLQTHVSAPKSFIVSFGSIVVLALLEYVFHEGISLITRLSMEELMHNQTIWALIGFFQSLLFISLAILISKVRKPDEGAWKR
ncbi:hypothetical protein SAMN00017405_1797 [Desulfonispora thiosulfatigenes DSM 11270]|uniref:Uncharacterized protein n=1 Tax=Desulfonispora thiosulfatigenes DSM 11270 TaxID=656914 RepID=A0A1W1V4I8_DESTI|nr:hypothetical protein [Desulfonispora thiosulfatigenes]SMB87931.1 hypothetical protein SAMN00017405_1797 [Desulfonispora thiosulfatigenes DSM 11270]